MTFQPNYDTSGKGTHTSGTSPKTFTLVTNWKATIFVAAWTNQGSNVITDLKVDGVSCTSIGTSANPGTGNGFFTVGYISGIAAGSHTIECDFTGTSFIDLFAADYYGVTSIASVAKNTTGANTYTPTVTTADGDFLVLIGTNAITTLGGYTVSGQSGATARQTISNASSGSGLFIADSTSVFGAGTNGVSVKDAENGSSVVWNTFLITLSTTPLKEVSGTPVETQTMGFSVSTSEVSGAPVESERLGYGWSNQSKNSSSWTNEQKH